MRTLQRIKERQRQEAEAEAAAPLTAVQIARLQWQVAQLLRPGETVAAGLRRLGGGQRGRPAKRAKRAPHSASATASGANEAERNPQDKEWFDQLTEAASALVDVGESDVYDKDREYFKRAASVYIDVDDDEDQGGGGNAGQGSLGGEGLLRQSKAAYEDADEDMFASDGEGQGNGDAGAAAERQTEKNQQEAVAGVNALQSAARGPEDATDYGNWPVKELRRFLQERGVDTGGIVEKPELVAKVKEVAATQSASREAASAPPGYAFDSGSGMYWSAESGMYWDAASKGFYNPADSKWYSYSGGQWVEWGALT